MRSIIPFSPPHRDVPKVAPQPLVVLADDDDEIRGALGQLLKADGFDVKMVADGERLVSYLDHCESVERLPDLIIMDHEMPGYSGMEVLEGLTQAQWRVPVLVITAFGAEVAELAQAQGALVLQKPFDSDDLRTVVLCLVDWSRSQGGPRARPSNN